MVRPFSDAVHGGRRCLPSVPHSILPVRRDGSLERENVDELDAYDGRGRGVRIAVGHGCDEAEHRTRSMPEQALCRKPVAAAAEPPGDRIDEVESAYYAPMVDVSIVGAAGYTGQETLDRVLGHPQLRLVAIGSDSLAGKPAGALDPRLEHAGLPAFVSNDQALAQAAEVTIVCLSHEAAAGIDVPADGVVVDLSGAHRLRDASSYEAWYGFTHPRPEGLGDWVYGLPELVAETGRLIANPGCYATATLLALAPLVGSVEPGSVVVDGLSGMTGAGRSLKPTSHAGSVLENVSPYRVGAHQHVPEITQLLGFPVSFTPHLLPVRRGLIATCNVRSTGPDLRALLEAAYAGSAVVTVLAEGVAPELSRVQHTDRAEIGVFEDGFTDRTIVICAEDNLGKGAAGQAIQNVNRALGLEDTAGLRLAGVPV